LWWLHLDAPASVVRRLEAVLAPDERARADRFRAEHDRRRFVLRRAALREILGRRLGVAASELRFAHGPHGKPALPGVTFNLSHSGDVGVCAVADAREVGVDVERIRTDLDVQPLAERFFTAAERAALREAPSSAFFALWTLKEAVLKAWGTGLSVPPESVDVSGALAGEAPVNGRWTVRALAGRDGVAAGLALEGAALDAGWRAWSPG
jgi:4'-phosphopantetheinyl transferase